MRERPILFSGAMVRALLAGTKTQTRRVAKGVVARHTRTGEALADIDSAGPRVACPYGQPGDRLWVREAFSGPHIWERSDDGEVPALPPGTWPTDSPIWYWADGEPTHGDWTRPRPSIHMPRWASRILLEVTGVRVERLQDISEADAIAEGIERSYDGWRDYRTDPAINYPSALSAIDSFRTLWESINGAGSWDTNPWVWAIAFRRVVQGESDE